MLASVILSDLQSFGWTVDCAISRRNQLQTQSRCITIQMALQVELTHIQYTIWSHLSQMIRIHCRFSGW